MTLTNKKSYSDTTFKRIDLQHRQVLQSEFDNCKFIHCDFSDAQFQICRFTDCTFEDCNFKMAQIQGCVFSKVKFTKCSLMGVDWTQANWNDWATKLGALLFFECDLKYGIFFGLNLHQFKLIGCYAHEANFSEADLSEADCKNTDFAGALFHNCNLTQANFVGAKNYAIDITHNIIKKAKFSLPEATRLLFYLDIMLIDPQTQQIIEHPDDL